MNNTGTKYVRNMKQTAFWRESIGEYIPCLKYSVLILVKYIYIKCKLVSAEGRGHCNCVLFRPSLSVGVVKVRGAALSV